MTSCVEKRARRVARREVLALGQWSPCIERTDEIDADTYVVHTDLPYLSRRAPDAEPERVRGFALGIRIPPGYPNASPLVEFLGSAPIFHPACSARFPVICVGHGAWSPDVGAAHFAVLHLQAIVGSVPLDTLEALHGDPDCSDAARYYRELDATGGLPLAEPVFRTRPAPEEPDRQTPARERSSDASSSARAADVRPRVRSRCGRRPVDLVAGTGTQTARCRLVEAGAPNLGATGRGARQWLIDRVARETDAALRFEADAPVLEIGIASAAGFDDESTQRLEAHLRQLEAPALALCRPEIAAAIEDALRRPASAAGERVDHATTSSKQRAQAHRKDRHVELE